MTEPAAVVVESRTGQRPIMSHHTIVENKFKKRAPKIFGDSNIVISPPPEKWPTPIVIIMTMMPGSLCVSSLSIWLFFFFSHVQWRLV
jgi:hypothetical protein